MRDLVVPPAPGASIMLQPGINQFVYRGQSAPVETALGVMAGSYAWVAWVPPGGFPARYAPGDPQQPVLPTGSAVTIFLTETVIVPPR